MDFTTVAPEFILITSMLFLTLKDVMIIPPPLYIKVNCSFISFNTYQTEENFQAKFIAYSNNNFYVLYIL